MIFFIKLYIVCIYAAGLLAGEVRRRILTSAGFLFWLLLPLTLVLIVIVYVGIATDLLLNLIGTLVFDLDKNAQ